MSRLGQWLRRWPTVNARHLEIVEARLTQRILTMASKLQNEIDRLRAGLAANTSATGAMTELFGKFIEDVRENADDADEVRSIADAYEANTSALVGAIAVGTPAAGPAPAGGAGEQPSNSPEPEADTSGQASGEADVNGQSNT
jgi:hypothetical protein